MDIWKEYSDYIVGIPAVIIGALVAIWIYKRQSQKKKLSYIILANEEILKYSTDIKDKIEVKYEGKIVDKLFLTVIRITNNGNVPILKNDFEGNIYIDFGEEANPISAEISNKMPINIDVKLERVNSKIEITPCLLNPNDHFNVKILSDEIIGKPLIYSRIAGVNEITETQIETSTKEYLAFTSVLTLLFLIMISYGLIEISSSIPLREIIPYGSIIIPIVYIAVLALTADSLLKYFSSRKIK